MSHVTWENCAYRKAFWVNTSADIILNFFFLPEKWFCHFMQIISKGDNLHEMKKLFSWKIQFVVCSLFVLFGLYVTFNNLSVISQRCLDVAGSSMLTFRVLLYWNITPQTSDMIFHPVTLYWYWVDQFWVLALLSQCWVPSERAASSIFKIFGMTLPGIEPTTFQSQTGCSTNRATVLVFVICWICSERAKVNICK